MALLVSGDIPATIFENARPGDWTATLSLSGLPGILGVKLTGADANRFEAVLNPALGTVTILPAMVFDRESYPSNVVPTFNFGLSVRTASGWTDSGQSWAVVLEGVDDAPPHSLVFTSGGSVLESDIGGVIGRFKGNDSDTSDARLSYRVLWPDEAYFEIVDGTTLKLREGVDLLREGGTIRPVMIEVSDGRQDANFLLNVQVLNTTDVDTTPAPPAIEVPPEPSSPPVVSPPVVSPPVVSPPVVSPPPVSPPVTSPPITSPPVVSPPPPDPPSPPVTSPPVTSPPVVTSPPPPSAPETPLPAPNTTFPMGIPPPPLPETALHLVAEASDTLLSSLKLSWQAERNVTDAAGQTHVSVSSGELLWLTPQDQRNIASGQLSLPEMAGASEVLHVDASAPGHAGEGPVLLLWSGGMADGVALTDALRGLLGDGEVQAALAQRDDGLLLHTLKHVTGEVLADSAPVEFHITGPLSTPPVVEPALPGASAVTQLIALAYDTLLDRPPGPGDLARWSHDLASGALDARGLVEAILRSEEFQLQHAGESERDFVANVYRHLHDAEMDHTSLGHWTELLESDAIDRADLVMAVGLETHHRDEALPGH